MSDEIKRAEGAEAGKLKVGDEVWVRGTVVAAHPPVAEKEDKMDNRDFKRREGLYLKFSEPMMEPHTPIIIERVNGDCTVSKFIIARDEAHGLINQLCEFLRVAPVAEKTELGQAGRGITYKPIESNGVVVGYAWWALGVDMGYYGIETAIGKRITETIAVTRGAAPAATLGSGQELREALERLEHELLANEWETQLDRFAEDIQTVCVAARAALALPLAPKVPAVLTSEDMKRIRGNGHTCGFDRAPSYMTFDCDCKCGIAYDGNWNGIISRAGRGHPACKCKPVPLERDGGKCLSCHHSLINNEHGFDQNDAHMEGDKLVHSGRCTYCKECRAGK